MAKASEYRSLSGSIASAWLKARLMSDKRLTRGLVSALNTAVSTAIKLRLEEEKKKAGK